MGEDPGWPWARKGGSTSTAPLLALRVIFSAFLVGTLTFGILVVFLILSADQATADTQPLIAWVMLAAGVLVQLAIAKFERPLDPTNQETLVTSYRSRCIIRAAAAEGASLAGLVGALTSLELWAVPLTALLTVVGWRRAAPTEAAIRRDDERLQSQGSPTSLTAALWNPTPLADT